MNKFAEHLIEFVSGLILAAALVWFYGSCIEIAFSGYVSDLNMIKILFA